ncbi:iron uptake porin [Synechococcus sp. MIT S9504]|uniref:iron uptake porin n=2 Tax=unclassified Synechococcus TaxID=2626047 RepID=UPI00082C2D65|nr:iron uptake porin [Synechococcus sp. MIT S9504]
MSCLKSQHWIRTATFAVMVATQALSGIAQPQQIEQSSKPVTPLLQELFRKADCQSAQLLRDRYQAAAVLQHCLEKANSISDPLRRLLSELEAELTTLNLQLEGVEQRTNELENLSFAPTTHLRGVSTFILGGNVFSGTEGDLLNSARSGYGALESGYDQKLTLRTSFTGKDLLNIRLRGGNLDTTSDSFGGGGPSKLSELEVAFQQSRTPDLIGINRAWYQFPLGQDWTFTLGSRVNQTVMLGIRPSVYPEDTVLDLFTQSGASGAYSSNLGAGGGVIWQRGPLSISANYIASKGHEGADGSGLIGEESGSSSTLQLGYAQQNWGIAAALVAIENGFGIIDYASPYTLRSYEQPGMTTSTALSGYWQPPVDGWFPSVSLGWGWNSTRYRKGVEHNGLVAISQSWTVAVQWSDLFDTGAAMGAAVGQPIIATALVGGTSPDDAGYAMEWWTMLPVTDAITVTPAVFFLSRPLGADTPEGQQLSQLGALVKTTLRF